MTTVIRKNKVATKKTKVKSKVKAIPERQTRSEIYHAIAEKAGLKRGEVERVFIELSEIIKGHMRKGGSGEVMIPRSGLKVKRVRRNPTQKRKMISPLTGMEVIIPAKRARDDVKVIALKVLKESVAS